MSIPSYTDLRVTLESNVATVEISAGPMNFLGVPLMEHLAAVWEWADQEPECRVLMLCAEGPVFCAGANFRDFAGSGEDRSPAPLYALAQRLFEGRKPVIAAIQGAAVGAGLGLAMVADQRVAGPKAQFVGNFVRLGFHPGFGLTATLPHAIGAHHAGTMLMSARRIGADEALRIGLVDQCTEQNTLRDAARLRALEIACNAPIAVQDLRRTLRAGLVDAVSQAIRHELEMQLAHFGTKDFIEGVGALLTKREPHFVCA